MTRFHISRWTDIGRAASYISNRRPGRSRRKHSEARYSIRAASGSR
ncbi:MAG: hypothetical protein ACLR8Y_13950 [Alistipes indistinctus]